MKEKPLSVWLTFNPSSGTGHSHPAAISSEQVAAVLRGVGVQARDNIVGFGMFVNKATIPAFLSAETAVLEPYLAQAFVKASPKDIVTFYLVTPHLTRGDLVTSGGLFVRNRHLYVILANAHSSKYSSPVRERFADRHERPAVTAHRPLPFLDRLYTTRGMDPEQ